MFQLIGKLWKRSGVTAIAALLAAGIAGGASGAATAQEDELSFTFVAVNDAPESEGVQHTLAMYGNGTFTAGSATGGGGYVYLDSATDVPMTILDSGTWEATEVIQWIPAEGSATYGPVHPGVVDLRVNLIREDGSVITGATLRINCNVGFAGIQNKDPDTGDPLAEGYWLTLPAGAAFAPTAEVGTFAPRDPVVGVTVINRLRSE